MWDCPSAAALAGFGTDLTEAGLLVSLAGHIDGCPACQEKLEGLARADAMTAMPGMPRLPGPAAAPTIPGFAIERELGRGSTGVVYQALEPSLGRRVALKVVRSGPATGSHDRARWLREARSFARVRHDNVVRLYQVGEADGWLYMVLELVPGGTLEQRLKMPYPPRDAARLLETIARAVIAIHREGLLHLDLKPSNILLDAEPDTPRERAIPRVGDFGIAFLRDEPDASLATAHPCGPVGTPSYMAPEQVAFDRETLGPAADVYGLGAILYHLLTGHRPFAAASIIDILDQVRDKEPVAPRRHNPTIPRDLETICLKCLRKDPGRRYVSAEALADDLRRWLDGRSIEARPVSLAEKALRCCRRRPAVAALAVALAISVATGFLGMFALWRRAEADFRVANEVIGEIVDLSTGGQHGSSRVVSPERLIDMLTKTRRYLLELSTRRADRAALSRQLKSVTMRLGETLMDEGRWDEARALLEDAVGPLDATLRRNPADRAALDALSHYLPRFASVDQKLGEPAKAIGHLRRALRLTEHWSRISTEDAPMVNLAHIRQDLAVLLAARGDRDEARSLILANRLMIAEAGTGSGNPELAAWRIQVHFDSRRLIEGSHASSSPGFGGIAPDRSDPPSRFASPESDRLPPRAWAELADEALGPAIREGTARSRAESAATYLCHLLAGTASSLRRLGRHDEARGIVDRLHEFGRLLVERYPDRPTSYLILSEAHVQLTKSGWQTEDRPVVVRNLSRAVALTEHAVALDPNHEVARRLLDRRQRRLIELLHGKVPFEGADRSVGPPSSDGT